MSDRIDADDRWALSLPFDVSSPDAIQAELNNLDIVAREGKFNF